ncbi:hypothetical protein M9194_08950 [Vibrio sp. S4M6]|uniref:formyltransferase family protein n=1 Tax=Vibrio sinus TaxID=2946865 RepID=UPI002029C238|nr:formyltransferase family protein [Vibrio sinus]MCL9781554.1 hypothetical protein [Vibrio sinus]
MEKVVLLGNDTPHRRYIINSLIDRGFNISDCLFQTNNLEPSFDTKPKWQTQENEALISLFENEARQDLERVSVQYVRDLNDTTSQDYLKTIAPSFYIVSGAGKLKGSILQLITNKSLNVHIGYAEEYRGLDSNLWAIYHGDYSHIGVTLHKLENELDTGNIIEQTTLDLPSDIAITTLRYYESRLAVEMLTRALEKQRQGQLASRKQTSLGRYYSFMPACLKDHIESKITKATRLK